MKPWVKYVRIMTNLLIFVLFMVFLIFVGPKILGFFMPFLVGLIVAWIANPLVKFLEKHLKIVRKFGSAIIIILVLALICVAGYFAVSQVAEQVHGLMDKFPSTYENVMKEVNEIGKNLDVVMQRLPQNVRTGIDKFADSAVITVKNWAGNLGKPAVDVAGRVAKNIPSAFIATIISILSAYFFIADRERLLAICRKIAPESAQHTAAIIKESFSSTVGGYFKAQFKIMGVVALILLIGFLILGVDYAVLIAILVAFLDMLPFFGTGTVLFPWAIYKLLAHDYRMTVGLVILYVVTQLVRQLIQPKLIGDSVGLEPLPTLFLIYIGYQIGGFLGMLIAIPAGMIVIHLYQRGVFKGLTDDLKEIVDDINKFRRRPVKEEEKEETREESGEESEEDNKNK